MISNGVLLKQILPLYNNLIMMIIWSKWLELGPELARELEGFWRLNYNQIEAELFTWNMAGLLFVFTDSLSLIRSGVVAGIYKYG